MGSSLLGLCALMSLLTPAFVLAVQEQDTARLWQPYRITPRLDKQQIDLSGTWELSYMEQPINAVDELKDRKDPFDTEVPNSVHWSLFKAGKLPHPYAHLNANQYRWLETKPWYYRKMITLPQDISGKTLLLSFDGIDYFARVWLNGSLLGAHEGMFGGPVVDITELVRSDQENELVVEIKAANWGKVSDNIGQLQRNSVGEYDYAKFNGFNPRASGRIVRPWVIGGGSGTEAFFVMGMWQGARIDIIPAIHIERPYLQTRSISDEEASLHLSCELLANQHSLELNLHPWKNQQINHPNEKGNVLMPLNDPLVIQVNFMQDGQLAHTVELEAKAYEGRVWVEEDINLPNPKLWYPNGLGAANCYKVQVQLKQHGQLVDEIAFDYGIRVIERVRTAAKRTGDRWDDWQFVVNKRKVFVKGMNWTPADLLLDLNEDRYRWALNAAKDMGVQLIRVWGGGLLEPDIFYKICNELGLMVWQDFPIGNQDTPDYPQDIWEAQVVQNILRLRNHPSLTVWCGGNEFNPYSYGNTATIGILERNLQIFDPSRLFVRTSPDGGAAHMYPDMDPSWYNRSYQNEPWISETGMHSMPEANLFYELVDNSEFKALGKMWEKDFFKTHPEFIHHFTEYGPSRVPRMLSRASHMDDMSDPTIESITEASQIGAAEWYQVVSEKIQGNYPVTTGLMPWVFKRHWPVIAIQMMDWFGQPAAPYYFLKRTYESTHVSVDLERLLWKAGETVKLPTKVMHAHEHAIPNAHLRLQILNDQFEEINLQEQTIDVPAGTSVSDLEFDAVKIADDYTDRYLFVLVELLDQQNKRLSRSFYNLRVLSLLNDDQLYQSYLNEPIPWISLEKGPWLKPVVAKTATKLKIKQLERRDEGAESLLEVLIENTGKKPAFMTRLDVEGVKRVFIANDNFFWLAPGEQRSLTVKLNWREQPKGKKATLSVMAWNAAKQRINL